MGTLWQDIKYGLRMLARSPGLVVAAVLCLGLGIGAMTTIFSVVNGALLRPFPYKNPDELTLIWQESSKEPLYAEAKLISSPNFTDCRGLAQTFQDMAMVGADTRAMRYRDRLELMRTLQVNSNLLGLLGVSPVLGRGFLPEEDQKGHQQVVILTHECWRKWFQYDPNVLGKSVLLRSDWGPEQSYSIVGVLPPGFLQPVYPWFRAEILIPLKLSRDESNPKFRGGPRYKAIGRLRKNMTVRKSLVDLGLVTHRLTEQYPKENEGLRLVAAPLRSDYSGDLSHVLYLLLGASGLLLVVACGNVADLLLIRGIQRRKEIAVRATLGADRLCVLRQLAIEGFLVVTPGLVTGLLISVWGLQALRPLILTYVHVVGGIGLDARVLMFAVAIALVTGIAFGLIPAVQAWRMDLSTAMKGDSTQATTGARTRRTYGLLVAGQIALAFILIVGAALAVQTFINLLRIDPGFNPHRVLTMSVNCSGYDDKRSAAFQEELIARTRGLPGVVSVAVSNSMPLFSQGSMFTFNIEGDPAPAPDGYESTCSWVNEGYFGTLGVPLILGRDFEEADRVNSWPVVIINRALADHFWPTGNPIGARLKSQFGRRTSYEVIGVVENECYRQSQITGGLEVSPRVFFNRYPVGSVNLTIRAKTNPLALVSGVEAIVRDLDDQVLVSYVQLMKDRLRETFKPQQLTMWLVGVFALFAFTMTIVGLFGVMAHSSRSRYREIAIRIATGAKPADILRMILRQGAVVVAVGVAVGLAGVFALARVAASYVYGVAPLDPLTLVGAVLLLCIVSILACSIPARRAARIDPMEALRYE